LARLLLEDRHRVFRVSAAPAGREVRTVSLCAGGGASVAMGCESIHL
jgi:hypothetical protein